MKHIIMRANVPPLSANTPEDMIRNHLIGNNSGNLLFQYSVFRQLSRDDAQIDFISDIDMRKGRIMPEEVNEKYDILVLPFANAFRDNMEGRLEKWTSFLKNIKIPAVVVGVGLQDTYELTYKKGFSFDGTVKAFVREILEHSASIGVRGIFTEDYLKRFGFSSDQVRIIGCPSMFLYGKELPATDDKYDLKLNRSSAVSITGAVGNPPAMKQFFVRLRKEFPNYTVIPQKEADLELIYAGKSFLDDPNALVCYPNTADHPDFTSGRARFFINAPSMLDFFKHSDFNIGSRFHGGVAPLLCGVPSLFIPTDGRVRELVDYHELPHVYFRDIRPDTKLESLIEKADFSTFIRVHGKKAEQYFAFLDENRIPHIPISCGEGKLKLDRTVREKLENGEIYPPVVPIASANAEEIGKRITLMDRTAEIDELEEKLRWYRETPVWKLAATRVLNSVRGRRRS